MNIFLKKIVFGGVLGCCVVGSSAHAISERTATIGALGGGVALGALAGGATYMATENTIAAAVVALGVGGLSWWALDSWLSGLTPRGRINAANKIVRWVESDSFMTREFATSDELVSYINIRFGTSWPLVFAREHLMRLTEGVEEVSHLIELVHEDSDHDSSWGMSTKSKQLEIKVQSLTRALELRMSLVSNHKAYQFQVGLYEKHKEAERQREHEAALKASERLHESWERDRDRRSEREEKEKDRRLKQQALDIARVNHGPLMVGI